MDEVYVVEIVATGPKGFPSDTVAEVAVCRMNVEGTDFDTVYHNSIALDPKDIGKESLDFLTDNYGIEPEELYMGEDRDKVVSDLQGIIFGKECTSFDVNHVFGKFLCFEPWDMTGDVTLLPSYSVRLPRDLRVPSDGRSPIRIAYDKLCPGDPAGVGDGRHAIDLATMSVSILMSLRRGGMF